MTANSICSRKGTDGIKEVLIKFASKMCAKSLDAI